MIAVTDDTFRLAQGFTIARGSRTEARVLTHTDPYAGLPAAHDQFYGIWLPASGGAPADLAPFEVDLNAPMVTPPEALVTGIHVPLAGP